MKLPLSWLKSFIKTNLSAEKIAESLTMAGLEVEEILGNTGFSSVVVGHVLSVENHPNADKLHIAKVSVGTQELQIVCGATNLAKDQKVPVALVGARLADYEITKATLRGVDSYGMICSERELGISENHDGILVLDASLEPGTDVATIIGAEKVLDVKVLANRPDCMSIVGLAREVAVTIDAKCVIPKINVVESGGEIDFTVSVEDKVLCPRYVARVVQDLSAGESPAWMKERLVACGVRPLSLLIDISNYVMLEYGQPLHFFDMDKLADKKIVVRPARTGEEITTLDGVKRKLTKDNLVIADTKHAVALAGVMGGQTSEIDENTKNIFIESAVFDKANIRRTSRALGLRSEAVARYEKGISQEVAAVAIDRAAELLQELAAGKVSKTKIDIWNKSKKVSKIAFSIDKMNAFLGTEIDEKQVKQVLRSLGFEISGDKNGYEVVAPYWRTDIVEDVDIYEEIIRIVGYDRVPYTLPFALETVPAPNRYLQLANKIRTRLSAIGFTEVLTYSFMGGKELAAVGVATSTAPEIQNPLVSDQQYLRPTLVPKMLEAISDNQFNRDVLRFFELGRSFENTSSGKLPKETNWLILGLDTDYFDVKGALYNLLAGFGILEDDIVVKSTSVDFLKKGIGADLFVQNKRLVSFGEVRESVKNNFDIKKSAFVACLNVDVLLSLNLLERKFIEFSKYQQVIRDLSAVFGRDVTVADIKQKLALTNKLVKKVEITDIYEGRPLIAGERSITIRFYIQSDECTLNDIEVEEVLKAVQKKITELGGKSRSGN